MPEWYLRGAAMVSTKYAPDYRLENVVDPATGKLRTVPVYRGPLFSFSRERETVARMKRLYPILTGLSVLVYALLLTTNTAAGRTMYVMLPFAGLCFPLLYAVLGCRRLLTAKAQVTREHRDKIEHRLAGSAAAMLALAGISFAGFCVYAILRGAQGQDFLLAAGTAVIFCCGLIMFRLRKNLCMEQTGTTAKE